MTNDLPNKTFKPILVINWKTGSTRVTKKKPKTLGPWEIPIMMEIKVNVPKNPDIHAKGEIDIPGYKVKEMFIEAL